MLAAPLWRGIAPNRSRSGLLFGPLGEGETGAGGAVALVGATVGAAGEAVFAAGEAVFAAGEAVTTEAAVLGWAVKALWLAVPEQADRTMAPIANVLSRFANPPRRLGIVTLSSSLVCGSDYLHPPVRTRSSHRQLVSLLPQRVGWRP
jgi:hypothetical protein